MSALTISESLEDKLIKLVEELFMKEMGFALVVEELVNAKKPIIGHNMIYDIIYLYNQFIDDLPETYLEFITKVNYFLNQYLYIVELFFPSGVR